MSGEPVTATYPTVTCVLVNWNGWRDTLPCLASLTLQDYPALRIVVIDNGSSDDSVARIRSAFPEDSSRVTVIEAGANLGFAAGSNVGIRHAVAEDADLVWLLNNDTVAPPDTCTKLVAEALANPGAGLIGSVLYYMHDPEQVQAWGGGQIEPWLAQSTHHTKPTVLGPHSYLTFASVLIPRETLHKIGLLYEGFFMYYDDADYALRVTHAGYALVVAKDTAILHKEGGSSAPRSAPTDRYYTAAGLHFLRRHAPSPKLSMAIFLTVRLLRRLLQRRWKNVQAVLLGLGDYRRQRHVAYPEAL